MRGHKLPFVRITFGLWLGLWGVMGWPTPSYGGTNDSRPISYETRASWYSVESCKVNPDAACPTASGRSLYELEARGVPYAADWVHHFGERLMVTNTANGKAVEVVVLDRGPARRLVGRDLDLSRLAFERIADKGEGVINVEVTEL